MKVQQVKINRHNRVKILCNRCNETTDEQEAYAVLDADRPFVYHCSHCISELMVACGENVEIVI